MITLDYASALSDRVGDHGIDPAALEPGGEIAAQAEQVARDLQRTRGTGWERWRDLATGPARAEHLGAVRTLTDRLSGRFDNLVVLGIGGSALGAIALQSALNPVTHNLLPSGARRGPRLFVLDNVDPALVGPTLDYIQNHAGGLERTLVNVISKSGETAETAAQFLALRRMLIDRLGEREHASNVVAITDPAKGTMREICDASGYPTLPVPEGVGGRFSVLSPVGLFPAAMCGIDPGALLDGAREMDERCALADVRENPAAMLASLLVRLGVDKGKGVHVMMPYANRLYLMADWWRQLWAESLGKRCGAEGKEVYTGFTPVKALGATDQHSQVQLYREGPNDKAFVLMEVEDDGADVRIPTGGGIESLAYLEGATLGRLLRAEKRATEYALVESARPNVTIRFPRVDERSIGQFIQLWMVATAFAGRLLGIDAYDQPAVETGKKATFALMGKAGFEPYRDEVERALGATDRVI